MIAFALFALLAASDAAPAGDEATIRQIVANLEADRPDAHVSPNLDWENAFGIRYASLQKRDAFYGAVVKPQLDNASNNTLETKVAFPAPDVAVADTYWHIAGQVYAGQTKPGPDRWGRTTYIFSKANGQWTEVIERVADLRSPYYKHIASIPAAVAVPATVLQSYAGHYTAAAVAGKPPSTADITVTGDHLTISRHGGTLLAIPTSASDFLIFFDPNDSAEYLKASFAVQNGVTEVKLSEAWDEPLVTLQRQR